MGGGREMILGWPLAAASYDRRSFKTTVAAAANGDGKLRW